MKKVLCLASQEHIDLMFRPATWRELNEEFQLIRNGSSAMAPNEVADRLPESDAVITGWETPPFSHSLLNSARHLKIITHAAGSVKIIFDQSVVRDVLMPRGITVFSANDAIAVNVAESTIGLMIMASHRWSENIAAFAKSKRRDWSYPPYNGQYLTGATVGLVSASAVARHVIRLLEGYNCRVLVYDPFLTSEQAGVLGVESVGLDDLFAASDIVSIHAPSLPSTKNMIGDWQLKKLRDGATLINTARGSVIDHNALLNECRTGRIIAALDVTTPEPLPADSEFWNLPNVILTPHISGSGYAGYFAVGDMVQQALQNCFAGRAVTGAVRLDRWEVLA